MSTSEVHEELVRQAIAGDVDRLSELAEAVRSRLVGYFRRTVLDEDLAEDLTQETVVAVLGALRTLKKPDRFWPWVFSIATNQLRQHFRSRRRHPTVSLSAAEDATMQVAATGDDASKAPALRELAEQVRAAMSELGERQRVVLALRVYEDMSHAEVARVVGCSQMTAQVTFFRARQALISRLKRRGVRDATVLSALAAFGQLTAASTAKASTIAWSGATTLQSMLCALVPTKAKVAAVAAAAMLATGVYWSRTSTTAVTAAQSRVRSVHFVEQSPTTESQDGQCVLCSKGAYEQWIAFPEAIGEPFLFRMQRWDPHQRERLCWWVQNEDANYYVFAGDGTVYIHNYRLYHSDLRVRRLPTDPEPFCAFLDSVEPANTTLDPTGDGLAYARDPETGYLDSRLDKRFKEVGPFATQYAYSDSDLSAELLQSPDGPRVVDERDEMHRRGWTWMRISGELNGHAVSGRGRVPFTYGAHREHPPWMHLEVADTASLVDTPVGASVADPGGAFSREGGAGSLFTGMVRPWSGFHTLDVIRRDAATARIWFSTGQEDEGRLHVTLVDDQADVPRMAVYDVDLERDLLTRVEFFESRDAVFEQPVGYLSFEYLQGIEGAEAEFVEPSPPASHDRTSLATGPFWPLTVAASPPAVPSRLASVSRVE